MPQLLRPSAFPDPTPRAGIIRSLASCPVEKPEASFALLEEFEKAGVPVRQTTGLYAAILRGVARALAHKPPQAERLRKVARGTLRRMDERGLPPPAAVLQELMRADAKFGHHREVRRALEQMRARGMPIGPVEYALLLTALGKGGRRLREVEDARRSMAAEGVVPDEGVYLALLGAYSQAGNLRKARAVFNEAQEQRLLVPSSAAPSSAEPAGMQRLYTAMMRSLLRGGAAQEALDLFREYQNRRGRALAPDGDGRGRVAGGSAASSALAAGTAARMFPPPDEGMCAIAVRTASAVGGAGEAQRLYDELAQEEGTEVGGNAAASLLAAHVDAEDWDAAYALFDQLRAAQRERERQQKAEAEEGVGVETAELRRQRAWAARVRISPYNVLIHGLVKQGRYAEADAVAERAREDGVCFDSTTLRGLRRADGGGGETLLPWAWEGWRPPSRVYMIKEEEDEEDDEEEEGEGGRALRLDLHWLTKAETRVLFARELQAMRERFDAAEKRAAEEEEGGEGAAAGAGVGAGSLSAEGRESDDGLSDLVLVTGYRRRRRLLRGRGERPPPAGEEGEEETAGRGEKTDDGKEAELKILVRELLAARGLLFAHPPHNPGLFRVPKASLREYFERERKAEGELRFLRLALMRYIPVTSLTALVFLVFKGGLPF